MNLAFQILAAICTSKAPLLSVREGGKVATGRAGPYFRPQREISRPSRAGNYDLLGRFYWAGPGFRPYLVVVVVIITKCLYPRPAVCIDSAGMCTRPIDIISYLLDH